jgi:hypothetical protein
MNWYKKAQSKKLLKNIEKKKQISIQQGWAPEEVSWAGDISYKLGNPQYFIWLLNQTRNGSANIQTREDDKKIFDVLQRFQKFNDKKMLSQEQSNINNFKTFPELHEMIQGFDVKQKDISNKEISQMGGAKIIYSEDDVSIVKVDDFESGEILFKDTGWCVRKKEQFDNYGPPFYMFKLHNKPYALYHIETSDFKDIHDGDMTFSKSTILTNSFKYLEQNNISLNNTMIETINKKEEINEYAIQNNIEELNNLLQEDLFNYSNLIDKFYLTPEVIKLINNLFIEEKKNLNFYYNIIDFYNSIPNYLNKNNFIPTENERDIIKRNIESVAMEIDLPYQLKKDPEILEYLRQKWVNILKKYPRNNYELPEYLKNDPEILEALRQGWIDTLKTDPWPYGSYLLEDLKNDPDILKARRQGWLYEIRRNPKIYDSNLIDDLKNDSEILEASRQSWIEHLISDPQYYYYDLPEYLKNDPEMLEAYRQGWINELEEYPHEYSTLSEDLKNDPEIYKSTRQVWMDHIRNNSQNYNHLPEEFKNDPEILLQLQKQQSLQPQASNMNWYKKANIELVFENTHTDAYQGQNNYMLLAKDKKTMNPLGGIEYSEFQDEIHINYMEVKEEYKRMGIATALHRELQQINPDMKINWGMTTDEGESFKESLGRPNELV